MVSSVLYYLQLSNCINIGVNNLMLTCDRLNVQFGNKHSLIQYIVTYVSYVILFFVYVS